MTLRNPGPFSLVLTMPAVGLLCCFAYFAYETGCTADLKTGSVGDAQEAIRLGGISFISLLLGLVFGSLAVVAARGVDAAVRGGCAVAFFVLGGVALWFVGASLEAAGLQACFAA